MSDSPFAHNEYKKTYEAYQQYRNSLPTLERMTTLFIDIYPSDEFSDEVNDYLEKTAYNLRKLKEAHDSLTNSFYALLEADDAYITSYLKGRQLVAVLTQDNKFQAWVQKAITSHQNMSESLAQIQKSMKTILKAARKVMNAGGSPDDSPF